MSLLRNGDAGRCHPSKVANMFVANKCVAIAFVLFGRGCSRCGRVVSVSGAVARRANQEGGRARRRTGDRQPRRRPCGGQRRPGQGAEGPEGRATANRRRVDLAGGRGLRTRLARARSGGSRAGQLRGGCRLWPRLCGRSEGGVGGLGAWRRPRVGVACGLSPPKVTRAEPRPGTAATPKVTGAGPKPQTALPRGGPTSRTAGATSGGHRRQPPRGRPPEGCYQRPSTCSLIRRS